MPVVLPDQTKPLDLVGVELRPGGYKSQEAFCPGCGAWIRINEEPIGYKGLRTVILQIPHKYPCEHYDAILKSGRLRNAE